MMIEMVLSRYTHGESALSRPWAWVIAMIDRLQLVGQVANVPGMGNIRIGEMADNLQELASEDFWSRE